jgi:adenosylmethionine-8-amino-7-oxononanoate aminotransferase
VGGNRKRREVYAPMLFEAEFIEPCYEYRLRQTGEDIEAYGRRAADELETAILRLGPENVAAFIAEPVVGATLGAVPAVPGYLRRIREICDRYGVLLILDEIMCGLGRTGERYACAHDGVSPDLLTVAKGLGGGFQPVGAVLVSQKIVSTLENGSGALKHGFTYMAHPLACAAAVAVQEYIRDHDLIDAVKARAAELKSGLENAFAQNDFIGDIRGRGLFMGIELVADRTRKLPWAPRFAVQQHFKQAALEAGVLVYPGAGCVNGETGDHVLLAPAFTITPAQIEQVVDRLAATMRSLQSFLGECANSSPCR